MGRHADHVAETPHAHHTPWRDRLVLAASAGVPTGLVMRWADADWTRSLLSGLGAGVVVVLATLVAGSAPGPRPSAHGPQREEPPRSRP